MHGSRKAISLLEVILALAILGGSMAVLGEIVRSGSRCASEAKALVYAQLHCDSIMAEITSGLRYPDPISGAQLELVDFEYNWLYTIEVQPTDRDGLLAVRVTVMENKAALDAPIQFSIVRWMVDPEYEAQLQEEWLLLLEELAAAAGSEEATP